MTSLQTKALVVTPIRGDKLDFSHRIVWLVRRVCFDKAEFSFLQKRRRLRRNMARIIIGEVIKNPSSPAVFSKLRAFVI